MESAELMAVVMLLSARASGDGLGDDTDVVYAGLTEGIDDRGKTTKWNGFIATEKDALLRVFQLSFDSRTKLVNVDGFIAEVNALGLVHRHDQALLIDFLHGARLRDVDFDAGLQDGRGNHENNEQHENHVHERDHVDLGERSLRRFGELLHVPKLFDVAGRARPYS